MGMWNKVTVRDYIELRKEIEGNSNIVKRQVGVLSVVTKYTKDDLFSMPYSQVRKLAESNAWAFGSPEYKVRESFKFNGRKFKSILNAYDINAGQFIDSIELSTDSEILNDNYNVLFGILLSERTRFKKHLEDKDKFEMVMDMPITYVYPNVIFFCKVYEKLLPIIADYLQKEGESLQKVLGSLEDTSGE